MAKQRLYLFVGYPGAGKTTVAQLIEQTTGAVHIWADHERHKMFLEPSHSAAESRELYQYLNEQTDKLLADGQSVIFDTNFNYRKDRDYLRTIAERHGVETMVIWVNTDKELAKRRAVEESHGQETRIWGNMTSADFDRIASHLEPPSDNENFITIDGTNIDPAAVKAQLSI